MTNAEEQLLLIMQLDQKPKKKRVQVGKRVPKVWQKVIIAEVMRKRAAGMSAIAISRCMVPELSLGQVSGILYRNENNIKYLEQQKASGVDGGISDSP